MTTADRSAGRDISAIPRAVLSAAVGVVHTVERVVIGEERMRTARGNAWEAVCADRARALQQAEVDRLVASLATSRGMDHRRGPVRVHEKGSSPRSRASQA
jgi:hypothetical protein